MTVPKVSLDDLQPSTGITTPAFTTAAEKLAVALSRTRVAILVLPSKTQPAAIDAGLHALLAGEMRSLPGCDLQEWRAGGPAISAAIEEVRCCPPLLPAACCRPAGLHPPPWCCL